jgi:hypothetical protein
MQTNFVMKDARLRRKLNRLQTTAKSKILKTWTGFRAEMAKQKAIDKYDDL